MRTAQIIKAEIAELEAANAAAVGWSVGVRAMRLEHLRSQLQCAPACPNCGSDDLCVVRGIAICNGCGWAFPTEQRRAAG